MERTVKKIADELKKIRKLMEEKQEVTNLTINTQNKSGESIDVEGVAKEIQDAMFNNAKRSCEKKGGG